MKVKKLICCGVLGALLAVSVVGCGNASTDSGTSNSSSTSGGESGKTDGLSFSGDIVGQGAPALDIFVSEMQYDFKALGSDFQIYNDNFTADTQMQNIESMASKGYDGMMVYGWNSTSLLSISDICSSAKAPFVIFDQIPRDKDIEKKLQENQYYVGAVGTNSYAEGENVAKKMLDNHITKALILGGSVGDTIHDARVAGFKDTFEKGGGKVLGSGRCTDTTEGTTKFDDLLSAHSDAQGTYALSGDYAIAAISALSNHPQANVKMYVSGATSETIPYIKDGTITYADSGSKIVIPISAALLKNYAIGNVIKDENGKAPYFDNIIPFEVNAENADRFSELYLKGHPLTSDELGALVGSKVTYQDFVDFIKNYKMK